jgi:DNA-binding NtrC family response regulator
MTRVLIIEDDEHIRELTGRILARAGYLVLSLPDTSLADELIKNEHIDVVLCDHNLGCAKETGLVFTRRHKNADVKVCLYTGNDEAIHIATKEGIATVSKPASGVEIVAAIERQVIA